MKYAALCLLLILSVSTGMAQFDNDPSSVVSNKIQYTVWTQDGVGHADIFMDDVDNLAIGNVPNVEIVGGDLSIIKDGAKIQLAGPNGYINLSSPFGMSGARDIALPFDSGKVEVRNVTTQGVGAFSSTDTTVTITIDGATSSDAYLLSPKYSAGPAITDVLSWEATAGALIVHRPPGGRSGLQFSWRRQMP